MPKTKYILSLPSFLLDFVNSKLRFAWSSRLFRGIWRQPASNTPNDQTHQWLSWYVYQHLFSKHPSQKFLSLFQLIRFCPQWDRKLIRTGFQLCSFLWLLDLVSELHLLLLSLSLDFSPFSGLSFAQAVGLWYQLPRVLRNKESSLVQYRK